jgi:hypothetical protein
LQGRVLNPPLHNENVITLNLKPLFEIPAQSSFVILSEVKDLPIIHIYEIFQSLCFLRMTVEGISAEVSAW